MRFYGNRCHHYTQANETDGTRVSIDFRVLPRHLHVPPKERDPDSTKVMQNSFVLDVGGYYELMRVDDGPRPSVILHPHPQLEPNPSKRGASRGESYDAHGDSITLTLKVTAVEGLPGGVTVIVTLSVTPRLWPRWGVLRLLDLRTQPPILTYPCS